MTYPIHTEPSPTVQYKRYRPGDVEAIAALVVPDKLRAVGAPVIAQVEAECLYGFMVDLCDNIFYKGVVGAVLILHHGLECFKQRPLEASFSILEHKVDKVADTAVGVVFYIPNGLINGRTDDRAGKVRLFQIKKFPSIIYYYFKMISYFSGWIKGHFH